MTKKTKRGLPQDDRESEDYMDETQKPLKLVLKVGGHSTPVPSPASQVGTEEGDTPERKQRKKKKKRKEKRKDRDRENEEDRESELEEDSQMPVAEWKVSEDEQEGVEGEVPSKRARGASVASSFSEGDYAPARNLRERKQDGEKKSLTLLLDYLHRVLSRKDVNGFFQFPVTDVIAPRYSEIIAQPMDFSTMKNKMDRHEYNDVREYKTDFRLMLENCMAYNHPDTIFHKEAQRMLNIGLKQLSKEKLMSLRRTLPGLSELSEEELGLREDNLEEEILPLVEYKKPRKGQMSKYEAIVDDATPEEILAQVQDAARNASEELQARRPGSQMGYLVKKTGGDLYLNFLNPDNSGIVSEKEKVVTLGKLTDRLGSGTGSLAAFREDKRNKAIPLSYLNYGPFSSYAPVYDSTTSNLSKSESDLLMSTYGDETGIQYSKSIREFVDNAGDYATQMVDNLLGLLTGGHHFKTMQYLEQQEAQRQEENGSEEQTSTPQAVNDDASLQSLSNLGIDMSFLDTMAPPVKSEGTHAEEQSQGTHAVQASQPSQPQQQTEGILSKLQSPESTPTVLHSESTHVVQDSESTPVVPQSESTHVVQSQLDQTARLLSDLGQVQHDRLSSKPPAHLSQLHGPSDTELRLAEKVTEGLTGLVKQVNPSDVFNIKSESKKIRPRDNKGGPDLLQKSQEPSQDAQDNAGTAAVETAATQAHVASPEVVDITGAEGADIQGSSSQGSLDPAEQLLHVSFSQEMAGFSPGVDTPEVFSVSTEEGEGFNLTNGMDTNETEAAVANIL